MTVDEMAGVISDYLDALTEREVPQALAVEVVFDFAKRLHSAEPATPAPPSPDDLKSAIDAKRARRLAQLNKTTA